MTPKGIERSVVYKIIYTPL